MLVALMDNKYIAITGDYSREQLLKLRKQRKFLCPQCKSMLQLKVGKIKTPHFAHMPDAICHNLFSEGESETHLLGKLALYDFLKKTNKDVILEPYLTSLSQRPDLFVKDQNRSYAIEFQCSAIDNDLFIKRSLGYIENGIQPVWVLNTPVKYCEGMSRITVVSLTKFEQQFMIIDDNNHYLLTFHPQTKTFYYFAHLIHFKNNQFISEIQRLPIQYQAFPFLKPKRASYSQFLSMLKLYKKRTQTYVENKIYTSSKGVNDILLRSIYELRLNRYAMPIFIGVPTIYAMYMEMAAVEWQTALFYYGQIYQKNVLQLTIYDVEHFIKWLNLVPSNEKIKSVNNYIQLLKELDITNINGKILEQIVFEKLYNQLVAISSEN